METKINETLIEGRNPVIEAIRAGKPIDKLYILDGCNDGPVMSIKREAKKNVGREMPASARTVIV